jgi:hypothetical protein
MRKKDFLNLQYYSEKEMLRMESLRDQREKKQGFGSGTSKLYFLANLNSRYTGLSSFFQKKIIF